MEKLSLFDFQKFCEEQGPFNFSLDDDISYVKLVGVFPNVAFIYAPDRICFLSDTHQLSFHSVQYIVPRGKIKGFGSIFQIVCGYKPQEIRKFTVFAIPKFLSQK